MIFCPNLPQVFIAIPKEILFIFTIRASSASLFATHTNYENSDVGKEQGHLQL
jgi:hypothetical protein